MPDGEIEIAYCHACGKSMDVSAVAPFSNVECPGCKKHTRVKREFGPYTLLRRHAIGGMSVVFIAQDNTLGREVIVKILNEEYGQDEKRIGAFEEEARITASFSHPHVVRVFTTGRAFERFYIAMELVPGGHFEHHIRERGSIPEKEVLPLANQVAAGLKAAHSAGLIHRDVKPGNILLDASGNAKIVDFGLALVTKGGKAQAAEIWATPYYVPPETIEGLPEDFRSDVYAFGATLYHALAGKPPCNEESMDTNRLREAKKKIAPLAKVAPWISADTCAVIERAMAHEPAQRFRSYDELLTALETARQRLASAPALPGPAHKAAAAAARRSSSKAGERFALAGASLLVVASLAIGGWWVMKPEPARTGGGKLPLVPVPADPSAAAADSAARAGSAYREAGEALAAGDYSKARELFAEVRDLPGVLQPTGAWAACEAVIGSYLEGKPGQARKDARTASEHLQSARGLDAGIRAVLVETLAKTGELRVVPREQAAAPPSGPQLLAALILGFMSWEQGMPEAARSHFDAVLASDASGTDGWVGTYQAITRGYLADAEQLASVTPDRLPDSAAACRKLADELVTVQAGLKSKGRAVFNLQALREDLERQARLLEQAKEPLPVAPVEDTLAAVRKNAAACRFSEASALIKAPGFIEKSGKELSAAILLLTEAASAFLGDLEETLATNPAGVVLELRDKSPLGRITGSRSGGLKVMDASGSPRDIPWSELSPDSLIDLHRKLVKDEASETERLRRHEQAIAFDLLAGDPGRAKEAAGVLAARYPAFKRRWDLMQPALE
jgi:tetratricopeptide (TPR) repeat protein